MKRLISTAMLLCGLMPAGPAAAESIPQPPCVCNDDCIYSGGYCNDWDWGRYCDWTSPGISCTDGGIPDAGLDAETDSGFDAETVPPDVPFTPHDVQQPWDSQPPDDVAEIPDGDVSPLANNPGCVCGSGGGHGSGLPLLICAFLILAWLRSRRRTTAPCKVPSSGSAVDDVNKARGHP